MRFFGYINRHMRQKARLYGMYGASLKELTEISITTTTTMISIKLLMLLLLQIATTNTDIATAIASADDAHITITSKQRLQKLIYLCLSRDCFMKISLHSSGLLLLLLLLLHHVCDVNSLHLK